jgi:hypothetical protein
MNIGHVSGGTNAGWRKVREVSKEMWRCACGRLNRSYNANCPDCYAKRGQDGS